MQIANPQYINLIKIGREVRWTKPKIEIPTLEKTEGFCSKVLHFSKKIALYPDQKKVFYEAADEQYSLVEAQTGAGKTVIAIALHDTWYGRTLVVCHSLVLAKQFGAEFEKFIGITPTYYCNGKHDQSGEVVITTHTTFRKSYDQFTNFSNLVIDEADLLATSKGLKAISEFKSERKVGFTGTIKTVYDDCNPTEAPLLAKIWGKHIIHHSDKEIPLKAVHAHIYKKDYENVYPHKDYQEYRAVLDDDIDRKKAQLKYITDNATDKEYSLALWDRVADVENFYRAFKKRGYNVYKSTGEMKKDEREANLRDFKKTGGYMIAVSATLNRGFDEVKLSKAFIMYPIKGENSIRQIVGRIIRTYKDKESYLYIWSDSSLGFQLKKQKEVIRKYFNLEIL